MHATVLTRQLNDNGEAFDVMLRDENNNSNMILRCISRDYAYELLNMLDCATSDIVINYFDQGDELEKITAVL